MRPLHLVARNFRTYPSLDLDLSDGGLVAVLGDIRDAAGTDSNGAGKSSILEAIEIALFGRRSLAPYLTRGVEDELLLELEFEHAGHLYRVRRTFRPKKSPTLDFELVAPDYDESDLRAGIALAKQGIDPGLYHDRWEPLTCASTKETQERICRTVGLSRDTFRHSSYLRQQSRSFADESIEPRERKRLLTEAVLGRDPVWPKLLDAARAEKNGLNGQLLALAARTTQAQEQAATKPELERQHTDLGEAETIAAGNVADLERSRAELADEYQRAREHQARSAAALAELLQAQAAVAGLDDRIAKAAQATQAASVARDELAQLPTYPPLDEIRARETVLVAAVEAHAQAARDHEAATLEVARVAQRKAELMERARELGLAATVADGKALALDQHRDGDPPECEMCGQALPDEARARAIQSYTAEAETQRLASQRQILEAQALELPVVPPAPEGEPPVEELAVCRSAITAAASAEAHRATLAERIIACERVLDEQPTDDQVAAARATIDEKTEALAEVGEPPNLAAIELRGNEVSEQLAKARAGLDQHRQQRARVEEHLALATAAEERLAEAAAERNRLQADVDVVAALERAYSPNGIPALILENAAIPYLETETNRILGLVGSKYLIELRTQAENKTTDGVRETLDVVVFDQQGNEAAFEEGTSGGEKTRIGFALRLALSRLLAHRGGHSGVLMLDEPGDLDRSGMAALVTVLRDLQDEFDLIMVVSHVPELRDSFDTTLTVVQEAGTSRIVEAGVFEAVPA